MSHAPGSPAAQAPPPDGGWGWVVVFASFMIHIFADGMTYSFGVFHYELVKYFQETEAATSLIASILVGVTLCTGPVSSALVNRFGCRAVTVGGAFIGALGLTLSAFAQSVTTLYFTIGILTGAGLGLIYLPAIVCVTIYFEKLRSLATGIAVCGSGMGTFILAPVTEWLVDEYTWRGAMAITGALMLNCVVFGLLFRPLEPDPEDMTTTTIVLQTVNGVQNNAVTTVTNRRPHSIHGGLSGSSRLTLSQPALTGDHRKFGSVGVMNRKDIFYSGSLAHIPQEKKSASWMEPKPAEQKPLMGNSDLEKGSGEAMCGPDSSSIITRMLDFSLFKDPIFLIFAFSNFCTSLGFNVPYVYIVSQAEEVGIPKREGSYLLAVIGIANTVGRIVLGYVSDKSWVNRLWVYNSCLTICGISTALSSFCTGMPSFIIYASLFGFNVGAYVGLTSVILVDLLGLDKLTNAFGLLLLFQGIASLVGPPITGWLYDASESYTLGFAFAGAMISISGLMLFSIPAIRACIIKKSPTNGEVVSSS